jgi:DNA polymerase-1
MEEAKAIFETYHGKLPFVKATYEDAQRIASNRGYIRTILGRRRRFNTWEPRDWEASQAWKKEGKGALSYEAAVEKWGANRIKRAYTHKALNSILQGSAADCMKKAMVDIWEGGICDVLGAPLLTVHDELCWSVPRNEIARAAHAEAVRIMETCIKLQVPLRCDSAGGANWGEC